MRLSLPMPGARDYGVVPATVRPDALTVAYAGVVTAWARQETEDLRVQLVHLAGACVAWMEVL